MVANVQERIEPRRDFPGASGDQTAVDQTGAPNRVVDAIVLTDRTEGGRLWTEHARVWYHLESPEVSTHGGDRIRIRWTVTRDMIARKTCPACSKRLSAVACNGAARSADGLARTCRACTNARRRQRERSGERRPAAQAPSRLLVTALRRGDIPAVRELVRGGMTAQWDWVCETMREGHLDL